MKGKAYIMKHYVKKTSILLYIAALMLVQFACGVQAQGDFTSQKPVTVISTVDTSDVPMIATGDLWVRPEPGDLGRALGELHKGELVQCVEFSVLGDAVWCKHDRGWSNTKWLKAVINE